MPRAGLSTSAVVDTALAVVDGEGADGLTLAAVAGRHGVAPPSLSMVPVSSWTMAVA